MGQRFDAVLVDDSFRDEPFRETDDVIAAGLVGALGLGHLYNFSSSERE